MVVSAPALQAFARRKPKRWMVARMEDPRCTGRPAEPIENLEGDILLRVRLKTRRQFIDAHVSCWQSNARIAGDAVAHGAWRIAVNRAEVALAVDERIAQREWLREPNERVVDRRVAVRVVVAHHVSDDASRLPRRASWLEAALVHGVQHAPVHGLQAVAHVRQRATDDDA